MTFPATPRVVYENNPLEEVICQLRFSPILRVDSEAIAFQDRVRTSFPELEVVQATDSLLPMPTAPVFDAVAAQLRIGISAGPTRYQFQSDDGRWKAALTRESIAVTTPDYRNWEEFAAQLDTVLQALCATLNPPWVTRVGLRYRNVIDRRELGLEDATWSQLLEPHIAGALAEPLVAKGAKQAASDVVIELSDSTGLVHIRHGLGQKPANNETCYLIDSDFYKEERLSFEDARQLLDGYNRENGNLFRWAISDFLHEKLQPRTL